MVSLATLALYAYLVVGLASATMGWLTWRSYHHTGNLNLLFVFIAFFAIALKALVVVLHEAFSPGLDHHEVIVIMGILDVLIVLLFFVPFLAPRRA